MSESSISNSNSDLYMSDRYKPCCLSCWGQNIVGHLGKSRYCLHYHCPYNKIYGRDDNEIKKIYQEHSLDTVIDVVECD